MLLALIILVFILYGFTPFIIILCCITISIIIGFATGYIQKENKRTMEEFDKILKEVEKRNGN